MKRPAFFILIIIHIFTGLMVKAQVVQNGYPDKSSYFPGDTARLFISGISVHHNQKIYLYDIMGNKADSIITDLQPQTAVNPDPWKNGFGYTLTNTYIIANLPSGLYNFEHQVFFIIKSRQPHSITIVLPTNTLEAYDSAGGKSMYSSNSTNNNKASVVTFLRPWTRGRITGMLCKSLGMLTWLKTQPDLDYKVISDMDLDDKTEIEGSRILMIIGHSEYWTRKARRNFDHFVDNGGNAMVLSGDVMGWQVRYSKDKTQLICLRTITENAPDSLKTIPWTDPSLKYSVIKSIGNDFVHGAYGNQFPNGWNGYKITNAESPIWAGTGLQNGDTFRCQSSEYDGTFILDTLQNGFPVIDSAKLGFCQAELIGYDYGFSHYFTPKKGYGTFIVFKKDSASGIVINTGFNEFTTNAKGVNIPGDGFRCTGFEGRDSAIMHRVCQNMISLLLKNENVFSTDSKCTNDVVTPRVITGYPLEIYPNPTANDIYINNDSLQWISLALYNISGQKVFEAPQSNGVTLHYSLNGLANGLYIYVVNNANGQKSTGRLIIMQ